jgi:hypothetical protein
MMKSGCQKDILEHTMEPLPDPIKGAKKNDDETDQEVAKHIDECLTTELVLQLDVDNNLANETNHGIYQHSFMSLSILRDDGKDQCGYNCINPPECKVITVEHQNEWAGARMIIIDEISFASATSILNLHEKLSRLKQVASERYGGVHVIFTFPAGTREWNAPLRHEPNFAPWGMTG